MPSPPKRQIHVLKDPHLGTLVLSFAGDPRFGLVCKKWKTLQKNSFRFVLDSLCKRMVLSALTQHIPFRLSFPSSQMRWLFQQVKELALQYQLKPADFRASGISLLSLDQLLLKIESFRKELFERLHNLHLAPVITLSGAQFPIPGITRQSTLAQIQYHLGRALARTNLLISIVARKGSFSNPRLDRLEKRQEILKARLRRIQVLAAQAKRAALSN